MAYPPLTSFATDPTANDTLAAVPHDTLHTNVQAWLRTKGWLDYRDFGAACDGVTDDTVAIAATYTQAASTGQHVHHYGTPKVTDMVTVPNGVTVFGDGVTKSYFVVESDFNMSALGVVRLGTGEPGGILRDVGIQFAQDTSITSRASAIQYPPAVYAVAAPRFVLDGVRWSGAWDGLKATGNSGGAWIDRIESGALNVGLEVDGSLDFFHIGRWHSWPFGMASGNIYPDVYSDGSTIAAEFTRCDGLEIGSFSSFKGRFIVNAGTGLGCFGTIGTLQLDGNYARLEKAGGNIAIGAMYATTALQDDYFVHQTGGFLSVGSYWFSHGGTSSTAPMFDIDGGVAVFGNGFERSMQPGQSIFDLSAGRLNINGLEVSSGAGANRTAPYIKQTGGLISIVGVTPPAKGGGSGTFISIATDDAHAVKGSPANGWTVTLPSTNAGGGQYDRQIVETFAPTISFATVGDASPSYATQTGQFIREGLTAWFYIKVDATFNAYTTASGQLRLNGLPLTLAADADVPLSLWRGINLGTSETYVMARVVSGQTYAAFVQSGDNVGNAFVTDTEVVAGSHVVIEINARVLL